MVWPHHHYYLFSIKHSRFAPSCVFAFLNRSPDIAFNPCRSRRASLLRSTSSQLPRRHGGCVAHPAIAPPRQIFTEALRGVAEVLHPSRLRSARRLGRELHLATTPRGRGRKTSSPTNAFSLGASEPKRRFLPAADASNVASLPRGGAKVAVLAERHACPRRYLSRRGIPSTNREGKEEEATPCATTDLPPRHGW